MAASVRIEDEAFSDVRYDVLASACALADADHALGKMTRLWRQCTAMHSYVLPASVVCAVLGPNGASALVESNLGEVVEGGIRIRGTRGRIEWLKKLRQNAKKGGTARAAKRLPKGSQEEAKTLPPPSPPAPAPAPAQKEEVAAPPLRLESPGLAEVKRKAGEVATGYSELIAAFHARYKARYKADHGWGDKTGKQVKDLLKRYGLEEALTRLANLFDLPRSFPKEPYDFATFVQHFDKLVVIPSQSSGQLGAPLRTSQREEIVSPIMALIRPEEPDAA